MVMSEFSTTIGEMFIAEIGPNHDGKLKLLDLIKKVAAAGADAIKFQTYSSAGHVVAQHAPPLIT